MPIEVTISERCLEISRLIIGGSETSPLPECDQGRVEASTLQFECRVIQLEVVIDLCLDQTTAAAAHIFYFESEKVFSAHHYVLENVLCSYMPSLCSARCNNRSFED